jgi:hypothetical protein
MAAARRRSAARAFSFQVRGSVERLAIRGTYCPSDPAAVAPRLSVRKVQNSHRP